MFQLNGDNIVQFICLIIYAIVISIVLYSRQVRLKKLFTVFIATTIGVSLSSLLMNLQLPYEQFVFWKLSVSLFGLASVVAFAHFIAAYANRDTGKIVGADRIAVMAALNMAHDLLEQKYTRDEYQLNVSKRIRALQDKIDLALNSGNQLEL